MIGAHPRAGHGEVVKYRGQCLDCEGLDPLSGRVGQVVLSYHAVTVTDQQLGANDHGLADCKLAKGEPLQRVMFWLLRLRL